MSWGMQTSGFSGLSAISTGPMGTGATQAAPATASAAGVAQGITSLGTSCAFCNSSAGKQMLFFVALVLILVFWHTHLHSMME